MYFLTVLKPGSPGAWCQQAMPNKAPWRPPSHCPHKVTPHCLLCSLSQEDNLPRVFSYKGTDPVRLGSLPMALAHPIYLLGPYVLGTVTWALVSFEN